MRKTIKKVCVFCASSNRTDGKFRTSASRLGELFAEQRVTTVYGGGSRGLMGALADGALAHKGSVIGIIPEFMLDLEWGHKNLTELIVVQTMSERKSRMIEDTDAVVALPGGTGTLEELMETLSLKRLGMYTKPVILVNINGFYDPLLEFLDRCINNGFLDEKHRDLWRVAGHSDEVLDVIAQTPDWPEDAIHFAAV